MQRPLPRKSRSAIACEFVPIAVGGVFMPQLTGIGYVENAKLNAMEKGLAASVNLDYAIFHLLLLCIHSDIARLPCGARSMYISVTREP